MNRKRIKKFSHGSTLGLNCQSNLFRHPATSGDTIGTITGRLRDVRNVFKRSLEEISKDAIEAILDLIAQKSLYKGAEWRGILTEFLALHNEYHDLLVANKENYCWSKSVKVSGSIGKIRNHSIGVLLTNITQEMDLNEAVRKYEIIVAPTNYKRPKAIFTKKMIEQAQKTITELGYLDSLGRRHAMIEDITINNIQFANKDTMKQMSGDIFSDLKQDAVSNPKNFDKMDEVSIETFVKDILPRTTNIELYLENRHAPNLMSVIAPKIKDNKTMFKWNNNFSWAYAGNITDSMKERVKAAGGKVDGILRFSIQWNDDKYNPNDFDAHCIEPNRNHIWFQRKMPYIHPSTGRLDVDIIDPTENIVAVENITWTDISKMQEGRYKFYVHNYTHRGGRDGFKAEIEYDGQIYSYEYNKELLSDDNVTVAEIEFSRAEGVRFIKSLDSSVSSKTIWNIQTNQFHPVSVCMFSPNYWDGQDGSGFKGIGHKHYFFIMNQCKNPDQPNGFFNEFLKEDLLKHKRVFEALGSKMRVEQSTNQLSGLGFSSTKRNSVVCKLEGHISRVLKITF